MPKKQQHYFEQLLVLFSQNEVFSEIFGFKTLTFLSKFQKDKVLQDKVLTVVGLFSAKGWSPKM